MTKTEQFNGSTLEFKTTTTRDAVGNTLKALSTGNNTTDFTRTQYKRADSYREVATERFATGGANQIGNTTTNYDARGQITSVRDVQAATTRSFVTDFNGMIRSKTSQKDGQTAKTQRYVYANNQLAGSFGEIDTTARFDPGVSIDASSLQGSPSQYVVNLGDTLQRIAQTVYGDSSRWYLIAEANGLSVSSTDTLTAGQTLNMPKLSSVNYNTSSSFKPYNPQAIIGDTTPTLSAPPKPMCSKEVAQFIAVVITVIIVIVSKGTALKDSPYIYAAVVAALSSVSTQLVMMTAGYQDKFSWTQVAVAAASAVLTAGATSGMNGTGTGTAMGRAAVSSVVSQGISIAVGIQKEFDWKGVAIAAVSAGINAELDDRMKNMLSNGNDPARWAAMVGKNLIANTITQGLKSVAYNTGKMDWAAVATDTFQNTIGDERAYREKLDEWNAPNLFESRGGASPLASYAPKTKEAELPDEIMTPSPRTRLYNANDSAPDYVRRYATGWEPNVVMMDPDVAERINMAENDKDTRADQARSKQTWDGLIKERRNEINARAAQIKKEETFSNSNGAPQLQLSSTELALLVKYLSGKNGGPLPSPTNQVAPKETTSSRLARDLYDYKRKVLNGENFSTPQDHPFSEMTRATWNSGLSTVEYVPNFMSGAFLPDQPDYYAFLAPYRAEYADKEVGPWLELMTGLAQIPFGRGIGIAREGAFAEFGTAQGAAVELINGYKIITYERSSLSATLDAKAGFGEINVNIQGQQISVGKIYIEGNGPELSLSKYTVLNGEKVVLQQKNGGSLTQAALEETILAYKGAYGVSPPTLNGSLAKANLENFESQYLSIAAKNPNLSPQQVGDLAIREISFGRARINVGYGNITTDVAINKQGVPVAVSVIAKPN